MAPVVRFSTFLERGLASKPDELALVGARRRWSWRELEVASRHYGQHLLASGLRRGDRVASLLPEGDALVVHYLGCLRAGLVATPLNFRYTPPEIDHALRVSGARLLVFDTSRSADVAASVMAGALELGTVADGAGPAGRRFDELLAAPADPRRLSTGEPDARTSAICMSYAHVERHRSSYGCLRRRATSSDLALAVGTRICSSTAYRAADRRPLSFAHLVRAEARFATPATASSRARGGCIHRVMQQ